MPKFNFKYLISLFYMLSDQVTYILEELGIISKNKVFHGKICWGILSFIPCISAGIDQIVFSLEDPYPKRTFPVNPFAGEAADAALIVQIVQVDKFGFCPLGFRTLQCMFKKCCSIPFFSGTSVECEDLHGFF